MKKLLLLLLFSCGIVNAANINFPDPNFKAKLLSSSPSNNIASNHSSSFVAIDANGDGEIDTAEAALIKRLYLTSANVVSVAGIENFTTLESLTFNELQMPALDLTGMGSVKFLEILHIEPLATLNLSNMTSLMMLKLENNFSLTTIDISTLTGLYDFTSHNNTALTTLNVGNLPHVEGFSVNISPNLSSLDVSALTTLQFLSCSGTAVSTLNVLPLTNLVNFSCQANPNLTALDVSTLSQLKEFSIQQTPFTTLNFAALTSLERLRMGDTAFPTMDFSVMPQLKLLNMSNGPITSLDFSPLVNLEYLTVACPQVATLDFTGLVNLRNLTVENASQIDLDLTVLPRLGNLELIECNATAIDLSHSTNYLSSLKFYSNPNLQFINAKNGSGFMELIVFGSPQLVQVCIDDPIPFSTMAITMDDNTNPQVGSYCSFLPGGNYNTISGNVRFDADANGCDANDPIFENMKVKFETSAGNSAVFVNETGGYQLFVQLEPNVVVSPVLENPTYFNVTPPNATITFPNLNSTHTQDFCITANGTHHDVEIAIVPQAPARPGFDAFYKLIYKNKGNQVASGTVAFGYEDGVFDFVDATPAPDNQFTGQLAFNYSNLLPFESREIMVTLNLNGPMEIPAVNLDDILHLSANISIADAADEMDEDNYFALNQIVVGSFDPNDKHCLQGTMVNPSQIGQYLHYVINFENTGTAAAENIVVKDVIDATMFDINSLQFVDSSHPTQVKIRGNTVEFIFEGIHLGASEHGNVVFKIKTKSNLTVNSSVSNKADIFFDYNFPVITEPAVTTFTTLGMQKFTTDSSIRIYPNPAKDNVNVMARETIESISVYDFQGRLLTFERVGEKEVQINLGTYATGTYYLNIQTSKGQQTQKMIRE